MTENSRKFKKDIYEFLNTYIKIGDIEIQKQKFNQPISIKNVNIDKIVLSNKVSFGKKGFK